MVNERKILDRLDAYTDKFLYQLDYLSSMPEVLSCQEGKNDNLVGWSVVLKRKEKGVWEMEICLHGEDNSSARKRAPLAAFGELFPRNYTYFLVIHWL